MTSYLLLFTIIIWYLFQNQTLELIKLIIQLAGGITIIVGIANLFLSQIRPILKASRDKKSLEKRFGAELYLPPVIEWATKYYIEPDFQSVDPAGGEEPRRIVAARQNLFTAMDEMLRHPTEYKYIIILADSGMGKTAFLLNYYARHVRRGSPSFAIALIPLGIPNADQRIEQITDKENTVLLLDAFDEDTLAIVDHYERLRMILNITKEFYKVIITCRTQFFPGDQEIPSTTGVIRVGPRRLGQGHEYSFHKLYLSPLSDEQVKEYINRRFPFWNFKQRRFANEIVKMIPDLIMRPMLLSHIDDLVQSNKKIDYSFELYEEMVQAWLVREEGHLMGVNKEELLKLSELLAIDLFKKRKLRGSERITEEEIEDFKKEWGISIPDWGVKGRSLLNRDAVGNRKFAHRSIMEYLIVRRLLMGDPLCTGIDLTDQMIKFLVEIVIAYLLGNLNTSADYLDKKIIEKNFFESDLTVKSECIPLILQNIQQDLGLKTVRRCS